MYKTELANRALEIYQDKIFWTYVQGGLGQLGNSQKIKSLYEYFWKNRDKKPNSMTRPYDEWVRDHALDHCTDCSNFINVLLNYDTNYYSVWSLSQLPKWNGPLDKAPEGTVLYMPGHIGLVVSKGKAMDFYRYECEPRISNIAEGLWKSAHYLPEVNYEEKKVMKTWDEVIRRALFLYINRTNITYNLGCSGEVVGRDKIVEENFRYYYNHGWAEKIGDSIPGWDPTWNVNKSWAKWSALNSSKMCFDCSGYIDWCLGYEGVHKYSSWSFGSMNKNPSLAAGVAGSALWKKGHVGLDMGYGYLLEIGHYGGTIELNKISNRDFTSSHLITDVDYNGADAR